MTIRLNGEPYVLDAPLTVTELLDRLRIDPRRVAVERNLVVVRRVQYPDTLINEGDEIEVVNFVGGGSTSESPQELNEQSVSRARKSAARGRPRGEAKPS